MRHIYILLKIAPRESKHVTYSAFYEREMIIKPVIVIQEESGYMSKYYIIWNPL